jgi:colanic acid biosynthesis glycosyl transferase WcaI
MNVVAKTASPASRLRILIYSINYAPELIGAGRYAGELGAYLAAKGAEVDVLTAAPHYPGWTVKPPYRGFSYQREVLDGACVTRCPMVMRTRMRGTWRILAPFSFAVFSAPLAFWSIIRRRPQTVVVVEPTVFVAPVALLAAWLIGARTLLHVQDLEIDAGFSVGHLSGALPERFAKICERFLLARFCSVVTISNAMLSRLVDKGVKPERLSIVRNWVDIKKIRPLPREGNSFRRELGLSDGDFVALYAGNIGVKQALHIVFEAAERLAAEPGLVFVIAGDGPEKANLKAHYGHLPNLRFLPLQPEERLCELLNLADLHLLPQERSVADLVLPSKLGGMLASGRDILVCADPGTELHNFMSGSAITVRPGDSVHMAAEIRKRVHVGTPARLGPNPLVFMLEREATLAKFAELISR